MHKKPCTYIKNGPNFNVRNEENFNASNVRKFYHTHSFVHMHVRFVYTCYIHNVYQLVKSFFNMAAFFNKRHLLAATLVILKNAAATLLNKNKISGAFV